MSDLVRNPEDRFSQDATRMSYDKSTEYAMIKRFHYANMPMEYTAIFHGCKSDNFQMKNCDTVIKNCDILLIFARNLDRGYTLRRF